MRLTPARTSSPCAGAEFGLTIAFGVLIDRMRARQTTWRPGGRPPASAPTRGAQRARQHGAPAVQAQERAAVLVQDMLSRQRRDDVEFLREEEDEEPGDRGRPTRDAGVVSRDAWRRVTAQRKKFADRASWSVIRSSCSP